MVSVRIHRPVLSRLAYTALGAALALGAVALLSREDPPDLSAVPKLVEKGFVPDTGKPKIPDAPKGTKPVAVVEGTVRWEPVREPPPHVDFAATGDQLIQPCDLSAIAVEVNCRAELVEAGGTHFGRTIVSGTLEFGGATRILPETVAGTFATGTPAPTVAVDIKPPRRWDIGALAGVSYGTDGRPGAEVGLTWRRGWLGAYALAEFQPPVGAEPSAWRGHGGVRITW